jgi:hypothetical protein
VLLVVLLSTTYIHLAGIVGTEMVVPAVGWSAGREPAGDRASSLEGRFVRCDSGYYRKIAEEGYDAEGTERAFFPLYPLLSRSMNRASGLPLFWSGLIVSVACFAVGGLLLYRLISIDYESKVALWSVIWACVFPMSFFFTAFYAEALFLVASVASVYLARHRRFLASGVAIALAGATRPTAFLLAIPYGIEFWQQRDFGRTQVLRFALGALIAPLGMLGYLGFLALQSGSTDLVTTYPSLQASGWKRFTTWPWVTLYDGVRAALFGTGINSDWFSRALVWQDLTYAILGVVLAIWALVRLRRSSALFLLGGMVFLYTQHGPYGYAFWSLPRFVSALFPIYPVLALLTIRLPGRYCWLPVTASTGLLGILSAWFASGRWVA